MKYNWYDLPDQTILVSDITRRLVEFNFAREHGKIEAIKSLRVIMQCGLREAKEMIDIAWQVKVEDEERAERERLMDEIRAMSTADLRAWMSTRNK